MALSKTGLGLKDVLTLASAAAGVAAISFALKGNIPNASALIVAAAFLDYGDGVVARTLSSANEFGKQLDSLADAISFAAAPAVIALVLNNGLPSLIAAIVYAIAGAYRLARFNVQKEKGVFHGLPAPAAGVCFAAVALVAPDYAWISLFALAALMVSSIEFRKVG
jgi:CDP-diacylglycerol--serine O-phosphatidyltransferase